jgi:hypothetical protein
MGWLAPSPPWPIVVINGAFADKEKRPQAAARAAIAQPDATRSQLA